MNINHLIILLVRSFAICLAIYSINNFVYSGLLLNEFNTFSIATVAIPASTMLAGILIWFMPYTLARSLTGYKGELNVDSHPISTEQFSAIVFLILALYLAYRVISDGSYWLYYYLNYEKYGISEIGLDTEAAMFGTILEAIFLLMMLLGRKKIFYYFKKLRTFD